MIHILFQRVLNTLVWKMRIKIGFTELFSFKSLRTQTNQEMLADFPQNHSFTMKISLNLIK